MGVILADLIRKTAFAAAAEKGNHRGREFVRGETYIPPSGKVVGPAEMQYAIAAVTEGHFTEGPWADRFEAGLEAFFGVRHASFVNSGSSANLLAVSSLLDSWSPHRLYPGDAVVTAAVGFPTTINPIFQNGMEAVLVDVELGTYVPSLDAILDAVERFNAKAVVMAHTLGAPWRADQVRQAKPGIAIVEDNCDAFGSLIGDTLTGSIGDLATLSFYPAHHITTGEGGAVLTNSGRLARAVESLRDWGRACYCPPGAENTCGKRFGWEFPHLPPGTDHKYVYERIGYNLKATDMQAAIGCAQLARVEEFIDRRRINWERLRLMLADYEDVFILPTAPEGTRPSWFGFCITLRPGSFNREALCQFLEGRRVGTRPLFAGFLPHQPAYGLDSEGFAPAMWEADNLENARMVGEAGFWVGVWPGLGQAEIDWIAECLQEAGECARKGADLPVKGS